MLAFRLHEWKQRARLCQVAVPEPAPGEILVKIGGAGICQSDLHLQKHYDDSHPLLQGVEMPFTLGHENAGWVEALGPGVTGWEPGQAVVCSTPSCGQCPNCLKGEVTYCLNSKLEPGIGLDGGLAEYMTIPAEALIPLKTLPPWQAAPLTDAGLTSYAAINRVIHTLLPGSTAVVIGIGGLGHMAVTILKAICAARVIAVDTNAQALALARDMGADHVLKSGGDTEKEILEVTRGEGATAIFDFVGTDSTLKLASRVAARLGNIVIAGLGGGHLDFAEGNIPYGCAIQIIMGGSRQDMRDVVALAEDDLISTRITRYALNEVESAMKQLEQGEIVGRAVMIPNE
jgi:propanol-preferring alcohol dehydrogenase